MLTDIMGVRAGRRIEECKRDRIVLFYGSSHYVRTMVVSGNVVQFSHVAAGKAVSLVRCGWEDDIHSSWSVPFYGVRSNVVR